MRIVVGKSFLLVALALSLTACGKGDADLLNFNKSNTGPDEFSILPGKPLEAPDNFAELPQPTPGGTNRTDPTPEADAVAALGGNPARLHSGLRAGESVLVAHAARYGVASGIRATLAEEDRVWRDENRPRLLERMFNVSTYYRAYEAMELDQRAELERLRARGVWTPQVPPEPQS